ncbi:ATP-dependent RecD-like DNA helicase [Lacticaseibacillus kribbianus]|uniref:SF1B family DNA helicase RecD2 n=1 Tax=Lacticaseibacillus kribbianus TaxID=2926292 RepID=UPI001CD60DC5|nr:ATP-dependent RecD-like DNA helicase [Lacticaseibacillus kribbianus]
MTECHLTGRVKAIFYENSSTFFKILLVGITQKDFDWPEKEIVVTGSFGDIKEEESYGFVGNLVNHPKYGGQFAASNYQVAKPTSKQGLINYLSSDKFPGIGAKTAGRIVDALGMGAIDKILKDAKVLAPLGLNAQKQAVLVDNLTANLGMEQVIIGLNDLGFTSTMAARIYQLYGTDAMHVIEENPYQLIADVEGIGFKRADAIAAHLNVAADAPMRLAGAVLDVLGTLTEGTGDTYALLPTLLHDTVAMLEGARNVEIAPDQVADAMLALTRKGELFVEAQHVFPKRLYDAERTIADRLRLLTRAAADPVKPRAIQKAIKAVAKAEGITYDETQTAAIQTAMQNQVFLLTGGPGTGKTTVVNGIVRVFAALNDLSLDPNAYKDEPFPFMLAAPTGRAAKRMMETTGLPASTIHRLLGLAVDSQEFEPKDLPDGLLIVDEMSMVDTYLFRTLLASVHPGIHLILVGDKDQLPSVGPGQVFADLLRSRTLPALELSHIHRQDATSSIIPLAHAINAGKLPADWQQNRPDRSFILCPPNQLAAAVGQVVAKASRKFAKSELQVLAPMYRGVAGIDQLNPLIQDILNPRRDARTKEVTGPFGVYRIGDKVLQLVNNPEANVYNGELGEVVGITEAKQADSKTDELTLDFDGNELTYQRSDWGKMTLAYATSIHKAQGSEFSVVILPLTLGSRRMLRRNLLYTAITRAKDFLILMGDPRAFELAVSELADNRQTALVARLQAVMPATAAPVGGATAPAAAPPKSAIADSPSAPAAHAGAEPSAAPDAAAATAVASQPAAASTPSGPPYRLTKELVAQNAIDPMIGMAGIAPIATK